MTVNDSVLQNSEKIIFTLRELYLKYGYLPYRMSKFEEYDLYAKNKDFLVSDNVITFTDTSGKLMALKPDVTLSIIKNSTDENNTVQKLFYNENVYRVSKGTGSFKEIMQSGVECFGSIGENDICEVLSLALDSLSMLSKEYVLAVSDLDILSNIIKKLNLSKTLEYSLYKAIGEKNFHEIDNICKDSCDKKTVILLKQLLSINGTVSQVTESLREIDDGSCSKFLSVIQRFKDKNYVVIDFSVVGDTNYYNGIVFKGFLRDIPTEVLSGGQYDCLMRKMGRKSCAIGFAVYTDVLERINFQENAQTVDDGFINVALPKGRLGEKVYNLFAKSGFECPSILETNRKLIFENIEKKVRYFWVKPSDVAIYVERGAADIGVAGKDILLEYEPDVYELLDLNMGKCRMAVAGPDGFTDDNSKTLRVATKFSNIAKSFYRTKGRDIDIIHLNGSIEIAPILGLSDVIVDIVETGTTLKENNLEVKETIVPISARLIANKASYKFKAEKIKNIFNALSEVTEG
ncbi:MAG: ATP phosphoribosyltransferase [Clostridia bacterium]|nr:ATP phosphoribosyltransferase [Clostridia bacterium]